MVVVTRGPIVERAEQGRRDARRSNPQRHDPCVRIPLEHSRLPECRFIGGDGPRSPNGVPLRLPMTVADFLQLPDHGQFAVHLARPAAKVLRTAVAKPALGPLERVAGVAPRLPLFRTNHVVEIGLDHARQHAPIHQHRHNHGDEPIQEQKPADKGHGERPVPPGPLDQPFDRAGAAAQDRLAPQEPRQVFGKGGGRAIPPLGLLLQAFQADRLQVARHLVVQPRRRRRLLRDDLLHRVCRRRGAEWRPTRQQLVKDRSQAVDIRCRPDRVRSPPGLFGGHVSRRPDRLAGVSQARAVILPAQAKAEVEVTMRECRPRPAARCPA